MASISPSSYPSSLQMASVSPFPTSPCWYSTMWVQISGHSSVQSSSTSGSRKAHQPIYTLRSKKIEQGQLLYPKIFPPIIFKVLPSITSNCSSLLKGYTVKHPPKPVKLGFWFLQGGWGFQGLNQVPYTHYYICKPHSWPRVCTNGQSKIQKVSKKSVRSKGVLQAFSGQKENVTLFFAILWS